MDICPRCCQEAEQLVESSCEDEPDLVAGSGVYLCRDCGTPLIAGELHPLICEECKRRVS